MTFYLDTNAWIKIFSKQELYERVLDHFRQGALSISVSNVTLDELLDEEKIERGMVLQNQELLRPFLRDLKVDSIFIIGNSRLGRAELASVAVADTYSEHLRNKNPIKRNTVRDGIHVANSIATDYTIVTCDRQIRKSSLRMEGKILCFTEFLTINNLGSWEKCPSCQTQGSASRAL